MVERNHSAGEMTRMPAHAPIPPAQQRRAAQVNDLLPLGDWVRHHSLRSWPVMLFLVLICVPSIALVILGGNPSASTFDHVAWIFAAYFAVAWLLLLGVIIRPEHVTRTMLVVVTAIALVTQVPLAITLETALHSSSAALGQSIFTIGIPEELAKALPVLVVALIYRRRHGLMPRDYLFLGAVSGLVFGASEVVHYFTVNGIEQFYPDRAVGYSPDRADAQYRALRADLGIRRADRPGAVLHTRTSSGVSSPTRSPMPAGPA